MTNYTLSMLGSLGHSESITLMAKSSTHAVEEAKSYLGSKYPGEVFICSSIVGGTLAYV